MPYINRLISRSFVEVVGYSVGKEVRLDLLHAGSIAFGECTCFWTIYLLENSFIKLPLFPLLSPLTWMPLKCLRTVSPLQIILCCRLCNTQNLVVTAHAARLL